MIYYKVMLDGAVVDAVTEESCCKYVERSRLVLFCSIDDAPQGIASSRLGKYYHVEGWPEFPEAVTDSGGTVQVEEIEETAYTELTATLDAGEEPSDSEDTDPEVPEGTEEADVLTRAELTAKVAELEEQLAATKILLGVE